jgi:hypothetical protein
MKPVERATLAIELAIVATIAVHSTSVEAQATSQLMDHFAPTPAVDPLSSTCWGAAQVGPRDPSNGLEDRTLAKWVYWDGGIIKAPDGTYHMFASRWDQSNGHNGWQCCSYATHATSKNLYGPYTDQGTFYSFDGGKGHNVTPFLMADGQYGVSISGVRPARVFTASSLDGPWTDRGDIVVNSSSYGFCTQCNVKILYRPDGQYMAISGEGKIALSPGVAGPYTVQGPSFYSGASGIPDQGKLEDPSVWYSGGKYHWLTNEWDIKKAFHFTSPDGIENWTLDRGYAYDPTTDFIRYADGTVNHWCKLERPEVYIEDGHVLAFTFAAINVEKEDDKGNDQNGSKVIVVSFDGAALDGVGGNGGSPGSGGSGGTPSTAPTSGGTTSVAGSGGSGTSGTGATGGRNGSGGVAGASGFGATGGTGGSPNSGGVGGVGGRGGSSGLGGTSERGGSSASGGRGGAVAFGGAGAGTDWAGGAIGTGGAEGGSTTTSGTSSTESGGSSATAAGGTGGSTVAPVGGAPKPVDRGTVAKEQSDGCSCALGGPNAREPSPGQRGVAFLLGLCALALARNPKCRST